ncbi:MAG TPA: MerR family transcriptional regulator [Acidimicrobiales bacterium]|nr:MerR family transcriptional regulator [Acidimicrobiales bacterium]
MVERHHVEDQLVETEVHLGPPTAARRLAAGRRELPFDDAHAPLYSVGQVAGMLGVQPAFLRRLDSEEVICPSRSEGGQRRYSRHEVLTVERVALFADEGMNLAGIRRILELEARVGELEVALAEERARQVR